MRDQVYDRIRALIVEGVLQPGARLRDTEIAEALSVSRTPVREAIRRLEDERLVVAEASRWTKVAAFDIGVAAELFPIIWTLERLAVSLAGPLAEEGVAALRVANDRLKVALSERDPLRAHQTDLEFHRILVSAAGNAELTSILDNLKLRIRRLEVAYFGSGAAERSVREHEEAIAALRAGDLDRAAAAIERNWRGGLDRVRQRQAEAGRPTPPPPPATPGT